MVAFAPYVEPPAVPLWRRWALPAAGAVALFGLLAAAIAIRSTSQRQARDAQRLSDLSQIRSALTRRFGASSSFQLDGCAPGAAVASCGADLSGWHDPVGRSACRGSTLAACDYTLARGSANGYEICFWLEAAVGDLPPGLNQVTATGLASGCDLP